MTAARACRSCLLVEGCGAFRVLAGAIVGEGERAVAIGVDLGETRLCCPGIEIGIRLLDRRLLQFVFGLQTGERRLALLEDGLGMIGGRACVAIIQPHQQLAGVNKFVVFHRHLGDEPGDVGRDRRHVTADIGVVGALEEAVDGPPVVAISRGG